MQRSNNIKVKQHQPVFSGNRCEKRSYSATESFYTQIGSFGDQSWRTIRPTLRGSPKTINLFDCIAQKFDINESRRFENDVRHHWLNSWFCSRFSRKNFKGIRESLWGSLTKAHNFQVVIKNGFKMGKITKEEIPSEISYFALKEILKAFPDYLSTECGATLLKSYQNIFGSQLRRLSSINEITATTWSHIDNVNHRTEWTKTALKIFFDPAWWKYFDRHCNLDQIKNLIKKDSSSRNKNTTVDPSSHRKLLSTRACWSLEDFLKRESKS